MKKLLLIALVVLIAFSTVTLGAQAKKVKIGMTIALFDDVWLTYVREAAIKWAGQHSDIDLTLVDAKGDTAKQVGQVENFLAQNMDAIIVLPVDTAATGPITKDVTDSKKPLVYINRKPDNLPKGVVYVGSRSIDSGIFMMTELGRLMGGKGNIVVMMGELQNEAAIGRPRGSSRSSRRSILQ